MAITDAGTIKSMVVVMRNSGMTFQEISDKLASEYGIYRSRQALHGLYTRATKPQEPVSSEEAKIVADVINIHCLGYNMTEVANLMANIGMPVSYNKVNSIIHKYIGYAESVKEAMLCKAIDIVKYETDRDKIMAHFTYKGVPITKRQFAHLIGRAFSQVIDSATANYIKTAYQISKDREVLKALTQKYRIDPSEIGE